MALLRTLLWAFISKCWLKNTFPTGFGVLSVFPVPTSSSLGSRGSASGSQTPGAAFTNCFGGLPRLPSPCHIGVGGGGQPLPNEGAGGHRGRGQRMRQRGRLAATPARWRRSASPGLWRRWVAAVSRRGKNNGLLPSLFLSVPFLFIYF